MVIDDELLNARELIAEIADQDRLTGSLQSEWAIIKVLQLRLVEAENRSQIRLGAVWGYRRKAYAEWLFCTGYLSHLQMLCHSLEMSWEDALNQ